MGETQGERPTLSPRLFTVAEANARLPLVRAITRDLVNLAREVLDRQQCVELLRAGRDATNGDPYVAELAQTERQLEAERLRLRGFVEELRQLGVEPKSVTEGTIDFPGLVDGRPVYLCWKLGEPEVRFWHELDAGFAGRRPLAEVVRAPQVVANESR